MLSGSQVSFFGTPYSFKASSMSCVFHPWLWWYLFPPLTGADPQRKENSEFNTAARLQDFKGRFPGPFGRPPLPLVWDFALALCAVAFSCWFSDSLLYLPLFSVTINTRYTSYTLKCCRIQHVSLASCVFQSLL